MPDPSVAVEFGKFFFELGLIMFGAWKAARSGAHRGVKNSSEVQEMVHEVRQNGGDNLRAAIERIETKTDDQTRSLLVMHLAQERRDEKLDGFERRVEGMETKYDGVERRVQSLEDHMRRVANVIEGATEITIKRDGGNDPT